MVRCFIGILVPEEVKQDTKSLQDKLKLLPMKCKFVEEENLHISLSFLGEIDEEEIEKTSKLLDSICEGRKKFEAFFSGIKLIPSERYVRVIALEANHGLKELSEDIRKKIGGSVKPPHLTLCRVKRVEDKKRFLDILKFEIKIGSFFVSSVQLIKSTLRKTGPLYTVLHESKLS